MQIFFCQCFQEWCDYVAVPSPFCRVSLVQMFSGSFSVGQQFEYNEPLFADASVSSTMAQLTMGPNRFGLNWDFWLCGCLIPEDSLCTQGVVTRVNFEKGLTLIWHCLIVEYDSCFKLVSVAFSNDPRDYSAGGTSSVTG